MKKLVGIDSKEFGSGDIKGSAGGHLGIEGSDLVADVSVTARIPLAKVTEPVMKVVDGLVDKLEKLIPGDQTILAASLKAEAREELVKLLSEPLPETPA